MLLNDGVNLLCDFESGLFEVTQFLYFLEIT